MPLAWAHAEYVKLLRSLQDGKVYDTPPQTVERYQTRKITADFQIWTERAPRTWVSQGKHLRMDFNEQTTLHWVIDGINQVPISTSAPLLKRHVLKLFLPFQWSTLTVVIAAAEQKTWTLSCRK